MIGDPNAVLQFVHSGNMYDSNGNKVNISDILLNGAKISSNSYNPIGTITRPNDQDPYAIGDVVGGLIAFNNAGPVNEQFIILGITMKIIVSAIPAGMTTFLLHLYDSEPTAILDNGIWTIAAGDTDKYIGSIFIDNITVKGAMLWTQIDNINMVRNSITGNIWGYLVTNSIFTPSPLAIKKINMYNMGV